MWVIHAGGEEREGEGGGEGYRTLLKTAHSQPGERRWGLRYLFLASLVGFFLVVADLSGSATD